MDFNHTTELLTIHKAPNMMRTLLVPEAVFFRITFGAGAGDIKTTLNQSSMLYLKKVHLKIISYHIFSHLKLISL